ncbi:MAG: phosphate ABC transporter permease subunit PstC [Methanomicrobiaceae archaeon]|nr:phosphate ABC transporter permease subunit PstC [Methanomicrobiaceae archaeon]
MNQSIDFPKIGFLAVSMLSILSVFLIFGFIFHTAAPVLAKEGFSFLTGTTWSYADHEYGVFTFIVTTLVMTAITLIIACPLSICTAVFLAEWAPAWMDRPISSMIELLVGIPSVVYGLFGFYILEKVFRYHIDPFIDATLGFIPIFADPTPNSGSGILLASSVLTIMILPTITALTREAMVKVSLDFREASLSLGATKWETIRKIVLPIAFPGILTAVILGLMRAMGETMAVVMLIGNVNSVPKSIFSDGVAMTSKILCDIGYYVSFPEPKSALFAIGAVLLLMEFLFVASIRLVGHYFGRKGLKP